MARSLSDRFRSRLREEPSGCLVWTGARTSDGYGNIRVGHGASRRMVGAHRVAWELKNGPVPQGMEVMHSCDNPPCVRTEHLTLGTHQENLQDAASKGRTGKARGEGHGRTHLRNEDVQSIRRLAIAGGISLRHLGRRFGVSKSTAHRIVTGQGWESVAS